jgi:hypothetical protein
VVELGFLRSLLIFFEAAGKRPPVLDQDPEGRSDRVIGYRRLELAAAVRSSAVAVGLVLDQCAGSYSPQEDCG